MTQQYSIEKAEEDFNAAWHHLGLNDLTFAVAFAEIVNRLLAGLSPSDFADRPQLVEFVFSHFYNGMEYQQLRELLYSRHHASDRDTGWQISRFGSGLRSSLYGCTSGKHWYRHLPESVNPLALWDFYHNKFLPFVEVLRSTGDAETDLSFLSFY